jgi:hypothetical protein
MTNGTSSEIQYQSVRSLAPTNVDPSIMFEGEDYGLKASINDRNKAHPLDALRYFRNLT